MIGEWCYFKQALSKEDCESIVSLGDALESSRAQIGTQSGVQTQEEYRRSDVKFITRNTSEDWLFDYLWKLAIVANNDWFRFNITKLDYIQLARYDSAELGEYKKHHDVFWINGDPIYHRKLTCVVQLSDPSDYTGGELELYNLSEYPNPEEIKLQGTVIFFPSFIEHAALPILSGTRYSLAAWFDGPKWK